MPYEEGQPALTACLGWMFLENKVRKHLFGGHYVRRDDYFGILDSQYRVGAILGRVLRNKLSILAKILKVVPGMFEGKPKDFGNEFWEQQFELVKHWQFSKLLPKGVILGGLPEVRLPKPWRHLPPDKVIKVLQGAAGEHLAEFKKKFGREPETFGDFTEPLTWLSLIDYAKAHEKKKALRVFGEKIPLEAVLPSVWTFGLEGIGFGSSFPKLTVKMYVYEFSWLKNGKELIKETEELLKSHIPEGAEIPLLGEDENVYLQFVAVYVADFYPELLDLLDLRGYLDV